MKKQEVDIYERFAMKKMKRCWKMSRRPSKEALLVSN